MLPFWAAGAGSVLVAGVVWGRIARGFAGFPAETPRFRIETVGFTALYRAEQHEAPVTGTERSAEWLKAGGLRPTRQRCLRWRNCWWETG